jgi:hypothetical protein
MSRQIDNLKRQLQKTPIFHLYNKTSYICNVEKKVAWEVTGYIKLMQLNIPAGVPAGSA